MNNRKTNRQLYHDRIHLLESSSKNSINQQTKNTNNNSHNLDDHDHEQLQDSLILSHSIDQGSSLFHRKVSKPSISELPSSSDFQNHSNINHDSENKQDNCQENKEEILSSTSPTSSFFVFACCFILSLLFYSLPNGFGILILFVILLGLFFYKKSISVN